MSNSIFKLSSITFNGVNLRDLSLALSVCILASAPAPALALAQPAWKTAYAQGQDSLTEQNPADAEKNFRRALVLALQSGHSSNAVDECQMKLADTLVLRNKTVEANGLYRSLLARMTRKYGNSQQLVPVLNALGSIQEALGDHTTAISFYQRALRINEKSVGPYSPAFAENLHSLARANAHVGNRKVAEKQYKQSISILMTEPGLGASDRLQNVMHDYTDLLKNDDDSNKSLIEDFKKDILAKTSGLNPAAGASVGESKTAPAALANSASNDHAKSRTATVDANSDQTNFATALAGTEGSPQLRPQIASGMPAGSGVPTPATSSDAVSGAVSAASEWQNQVATNSASSRQSQMNQDPEVVVRGLPQPWSDTTLLPAYRIVNDSIVSQGRYGQGADYYQRMIATDVNALGPHHPSVGNDLNGLAHYYMHEKDYAKAEPLLARAQSIYQQAYGERNLLSINTCADLAFVEFHLGSVEQATEHYQKALSNSQSALGPDSFETARILNELAYLYFHQGKLKEASTTYKWALASTEAAVGQESPLLAACMKDYALVLRSLGNPAEAGRLDSKANDIASKQPKLKS